MMAIAAEKAKEEATGNDAGFSSGNLSQMLKNLKTVIEIVDI
jgi:hypothetical protein